MAAFVVAPRRPGTKPSLIASMPAGLFGKFTTNGKAAPAEVHKRGANPAAGDSKLHKTGAKVHKAGAKTHTAHPKGEPAKPGKKSPTKSEREWLDAIVRYGCIACRIDGLGFRPAAVHHILRGGFRMGHMHTLPLCDPGHHQGGGKDKVSRHPHKARFEKKYGTEAALLKRLRREVKV